MKKTICLLFLGMAAASRLTAAAVESAPWVIKSSVPGTEELFPQGAVRLLEGPFLSMQEADHAYLMRLEPDRLLAQFRVEAGLLPKAKPYGGWESPAQPGKTWSLAGHSLGHYLSAASLMYRVTDDYRLKERVNYLTRELKECQDKRGDGSLVAFPYARELEAAIRTNNVELIDKYWAPFYTIHKEMAGLRDAWLWCGDATAREVLARLADWCGNVVKDLPDERRERLLNMEHGGMAEVLADAYAITGEQKYLHYARLYSHHAFLDPAAKGVDNLTGKHANTQVPKFIGFQRIHELTGDAEAGAAARFFWKNVVKERTWANGGNSIHEYFPEPKKMGESIPHDGGPETCNTYNMLKLTAALYREQPEPACLDFYENALFNHILGSQAPLVGAGAFAYYTPLRPGFARSYGTDFNSFWCCTGTGMENHARYGELIYSHAANAVSVNLFIASELNWPEGNLKLRQDTRFPEEAGTTLVLLEAPAKELTLRIRRPQWVAGGALELRLNGKPVQAVSQPGGFAEIRRTWQPGDQVQVALPMHLRVVRQPQCEGWASLFYGPILLAGELGDAGLKQPDFIGPYTPIKALLPLSEAPMLVAATDQEILSHLTPLPGKPAHFRSANVVKPCDVTLAPFYQVHFQRYAIYWQCTDQAHWEVHQRQLAQAAEVERQLDSRTIDRVRIGEQQPETDHNLRFEQSGRGIGPQDKRWREARDGGWFSYELKLPPPGTKAAVRVQYWGPDGGREFDIQADGKLLATQKLQGDKDAFFSVEYPLAEAQAQGKDTTVIRFQSKPGNTAGGIFDLRIMTAN